MSSLWKQQPLVMETKNTAEQLQRTHGDATGVRPHQYIKENITDTRFQIFTLIIVNRCIKIRYYHHNYSVLFIVLVHVFRIQARFELSLPTIQLRSSPPPPTPIEKSQTTVQAIGKQWQSWNGALLQISYTLYIFQTTLS